MTTTKKKALPEPRPLNDHDNDQTAFMAEIGAEAVRQGLTLFDVAQRVGMSQTQMSRRKLGKAPLTWTEARTMVDALGVSWVEFNTRLDK